MKTFSYTQAHPLSAFAITETQAPEPALLEGDLLVKVQAVSFNPVDYKIRSSRSANPGESVVLGWDAAGEVVKVGGDVKGFSVGDKVYYAGNLQRSGSYAELQAVDHRLAAKMPGTLSFAEAAALPLTSLTAWEGLFERGIDYSKDTKVLVIGGAGGVGSMIIQLLKAQTQATIITTASRPESIQWVKALGADGVIGRNLELGLESLGLKEVDVIYSTTHTDEYLPLVPKLLSPFGHFILTDDPKVLDVKPFKTKALSVHWEFMFTKSMFNHKPETQGAILKNIAELVDAKKLRSTLTQTLPWGLSSIKEAHTLLESATAVGKIVMARA